MTQSPQMHLSSSHVYSTGNHELKIFSSQYVAVQVCCKRVLQHRRAHCCCCCCAVSQFNVCLHNVTSRPEFKATRVGVGCGCGGLERDGREASGERMLHFITGESEHRKTNRLGCYLCKRLRRTAHYMSSTRMTASVQ